MNQKSNRRSEMEIIMRTSKTSDAVGDCMLNEEHKKAIFKVGQGICS